MICDFIKNLPSINLIINNYVGSDFNLKLFCKPWRASLGVADYFTFHTTYDTVKIHRYI